MTKEVSSTQSQDFKDAQFNNVVTIIFFLWDTFLRMLFELILKAALIIWDNVLFETATRTFLRN